MTVRVKAGPSTYFVRSPVAGGQLVQALWVPRTVSRPLISAFAASRPRSHSSHATRHARSPWLFDSHTWCSPAC